VSVDGVSVDISVQRKDSENGIDASSFGKIEVLRSAGAVQYYSYIDDRGDRILSNLSRESEAQARRNLRCRGVGLDDSKVDPNVGLAGSSGYWGLVRSWHDLIDHRGIHWRGDFGRYQPTSEKSLKDSGAMSQNVARLQSETATEAK
jgi:hypothetical protein